MVVAAGVYPQPAAVVRPVTSAAGSSGVTSTSNTTVTPFVPVGAPVTPGAAGAGVTAKPELDEKPFYMRPMVIVGALAGTAALTAFFMRKKSN